MMRSQWRMAWLAITALLALLPGLAAEGAESLVPDTPLALRPAGGLPLQGTPWRLERYLQGGAERVPGPEVAAWMRLGSRAVAGSGGCTAIKGIYGVVGAALTFRLPAHQKDECTEQTSLVQRALVDGLRKTSSFEIVPANDPSDDQLVLRSASGAELLLFGLDDIGRLDQADWRLTSYTIDGEPLMAVPEQPAILSFQPSRYDGERRSASGPAAGSTGCNGVVARFRQRASVLSLSDLERTDAPCVPALAGQEEAMVSVMEADTLTILLLPDQLTLTSNDTGESLTLASQRPVEGSTWLLRSRAAQDDQAEAVTLRLQEGLASGEGPCGTYNATYATDGLFITFTHIESAGTAGCADPKSERRLVAGLRSSALLERDGSGLRMLDASGRVTLRFSSPTTAP